MEHLNYCRQMVREFKDILSSPSAKNPNSPADMDHCIDLANLSRKFILPEGGLLFDDHELRALDEEGTLSLPFPAIALEFPTPGKMGGRTIIFARERDETIDTMRVTCIDGMGWLVLNHSRDGGGIRRTGYLDRTATPNGMPTIKLLANGGGDTSVDEPVGDIYVLLSLLNALQCSNVRIEESKPRKAGKKPKGALPFDTYHVLTIDAGKQDDELPGAGGGTHRSPREHLRRGHIRRLTDGRRIWVNATVVGAGKGAGIVTKDYMVRGVRNAG